MKTVFLAYWIELFDSSICHLSPTNIALSFETEVKEPFGTTHNVIYLTVKPGQAFLPPLPPSPPQDSILIIRKLNPLVVVDIRLIYVFLHPQ